MKKKTGPLIYQAKTLIPGWKIQDGLEGFYVAVPDRRYKGSPFTIRYWYPKINDDGERVYGWVERQVNDWNKADHFRVFRDKWGNGNYTLAYFKVVDTL